MQLLGRRTLPLPLPLPPTLTLPLPPTLTLPLPPTLALALLLTRCNFMDEDTRAWSSEGCTSKGVTEVNGCA